MRPAARRGETQSRVWLWPFAAGLAVFLVIGLGNAAGWLGTVTLLLGAIGTAWLWFLDQSRKRVPVIYDVNDDAANRFDKLITAMAGAIGSQKAWHMQAEAALTSAHARKVSGGAGHVVKREPVLRTTAGPKVLATNIAVPSFVAPSRSVFFLPDRILVLQGSTYADVEWEKITTAFDQQRFIEEEGVAGDAEVVGHTWKYVNKTGGPDRRFKDNRQLPICLFGEVSLIAPNGFRAEWQFSNRRAAGEWAEALENMRFV